MNDIYDAKLIMYLFVGVICVEKLRGKLYPHNIGTINLYHTRQHLHVFFDTFWFYGSSYRNAFYEKYAHLPAKEEIE